MLWWWFKQTLKFPLYSPYTLLHSLEKNDMYGHRISKGELYLRENFLKVVESKNMLWKKLEILNYEVLIPPDEVFEVFVEVADDLTMSCRSYLTLNECAKWAFSIIIVQYWPQISCHSTEFLLFIYS